MPDFLGQISGFVLYEDHANATLMFFIYLFTKLVVRIILPLTLRRQLCIKASMTLMTSLNRQFRFTATTFNFYLHESVYENFYSGSKLFTGTHSKP